MRTTEASVLGGERADFLSRPPQAPQSHFERLILGHLWHLPAFVLLSACMRTKNGSAITICESARDNYLLLFGVAYRPKVENLYGAKHYTDEETSMQP